MASNASSEPFAGPGRLGAARPSQSHAGAALRNLMHPPMSCARLQLYTLPKRRAPSLRNGVSAGEKATAASLFVAMLGFSTGHVNLLRHSHMRKSQLLTEVATIQLLL